MEDYLGPLVGSFTRFFIQQPGLPVLKDSFDTPDREHSQNKTWVSLLSQERSHSNKYIDFKNELKSNDNIGNTEETILTKPVLLNNSSLVVPEHHELTKTSVRYLERALLIYEEGAASPKKHVLTPGVLTIGRGKENHIVTSDPRASRKHFVLEVKTNLVELIDFSSENGTKINGINIRKRVLENGDSILVGKTTFIFQAGTNTNNFFNDLELNADSNTVSEEEKKDQKDVSALLEKTDLSQKKSTFIGRSRMPWEEIKQFSWTMAVIIFFVAATICLVLGGAMIGQISQEGKIEKLQLFYHELGRASHMAALGSIENAERIMNEVQRLFFMDATQKTYFGDTQIFIAAVKKLSIEKKTKNCVFTEKAEEVKVFDSVKKNFSGEPLKLDDQWKQAISLYKNGKEKAACGLVKMIASRAPKTSPLLTKSRSFLERRCF
jgi:pSer/pThr/pTyr-binding forkhead associated (FHA) protein